MARLALFALVLVTATAPERAPPDFSQVSIAFSHSCAIDRNGGLHCWGWGRNGKVGDGTDVNRQTATPIGQPHRWRMVSVGAQHACAIRGDGTLHCWGWNEKGRLGLGMPALEAWRPTQVGSDDDWVEVAAGAQHTCGRKENGRLFCWGGNSRGQVGDGSPWAPSWSLFDRPALGLGSVADRWTPVPIGSDTNWVQIATGLEHTCGRKRDDTLYCWGGTAGDAIGRGRRSPARIGFRRWRDVSVGHLHACGVRLDGTLWCWGWNVAGQLGDGSRASRPSPVRVGPDSDWDTVHATSQHTCARKNDGRLFCWGRNGHGRLGDGTDQDRVRPVEIQPGSRWASVDTAPEHSCGVRDDGTLLCWGFWGDGRLGTGPEREEEWSPKPVRMGGRRGT